MSNHGRSHQQRQQDAATHGHQPRTTPPPPPAGPGPSAAPAPGPHRSESVAARAYGLYEQGGRKDGHDLDHWLQAESQVSREHHAPTGRALPA